MPVPALGGGGPGRRCAARNALDLDAVAWSPAVVPVLRMHEDEVEVDDALVRRLLEAQAPSLAGLPLARLDTWGTDHVVYRLGGELAVRLPKVGWAAGQGEKERAWLPLLAPHLPVDVPSPLLVGEPTEGYPYRWYVAPWLSGENPAPGTPGLHALAHDLAAFVGALGRVDAAGGPPPTGSQRGGPLAPADEQTRERAEELRGETDVDGLLRAWDAGLRAPEWQAPPRWVHGDLTEGNVLVRDERLTGVIDWGGLKAGDPAVDLMVAWTLFDAATRRLYRDALGFVDDAMWLRGRAWAVSAAVMALPYYRHTNPVIVARSWRIVDEVLADLEEQG